MSTMWMGPKAGTHQRMIPDAFMREPGKSLQGRTAAEQAEVRDRIARMRAWKVANGQRPVDWKPWVVPFHVVPKPRKEGGRS